MEHNLSYSNYTSFKEVLRLSETYKDPLNNYIDQLLWWNSKVNLVSRVVSRETVKEHVIHSLTPFFSDLYQKRNVVIDAGTGGGLPGIPLSIVSEEKKIMLNDIVSKKVMACKQMVYKLGLNHCELKVGSIEEVEILEGEVVVSKHAFKINALIELLGDNNWGGIILLKGLNKIETELNGINEALNINVISLEQETNSFYDGKALVEITK